MKAMSSSDDYTFSKINDRYKSQIVWKFQAKLITNFRYQNKRQNVFEYLLDFINGIVKDNVSDVDAQKHLSLYAWDSQEFIIK